MNKLPVCTSSPSWPLFISLCIYILVNLILTYWLYVLENIYTSMFWSLSCESFCIRTLNYACKYAQEVKQKSKGETNGLYISQACPAGLSRVKWRPPVVVLEHETSTLRQSHNFISIDLKFGVGDYVREITSPAKFGLDPMSGLVDLYIPVNRLCYTESNEKYLLFYASDSRH